MQETLVIAGMVAGGLGLFLLAVGFITDGLKAAIGQQLRHLLSRWTRSPLHGIMTGVTITAIVQSSSAVTVAIIGFVNGGLMTLYQAMGVVFGANIGTTMTGWLVALLGFKIKVDAFALPMIGLGMLLRLTGPDTRRGSVGLALVGFGLFFVGIDVLKEAFEGLMVAIDLDKLTISGITGVLIYLGIGFLMTLLTQSSSAAIAITLTAANSGLLGLYTAAAMVIGANVGTTSTAALAVIGATSNAKRVASAHILFNVITGLVALLILPFMLKMVSLTEEILGLVAVPAITLALFHTFFNILGVLLMLPLSKRLTHFLESRFVTQEEVESRPRYLDKTVAESPVLAVDALILEMIRMMGLVRRLDLAVLSSEHNHNKQIAIDYNIIQTLAARISEFLNRVERKHLSEVVSHQLSKLLRAEQHLLSSAEQALILAKSRPIDSEGLPEEDTAFRAQVATIIDFSDLEAKSFSATDADSEMEKLDSRYDDVKAAILANVSPRLLPASDILEAVDQRSRIRRMARQLMKASYLLDELTTTTAVKTDHQTKEKDITETGEE